MKTKIMGILNLTPDSFSDGGKFSDMKGAVERAEVMIQEGADIIDIGGESTRPNATPVPLEEELSRVIPVIQEIRKNLKSKIMISIDTYKSKVAHEAITAGANIINDISGSTLDPEILKVAAKLNTPYILNHIQGTPQTMQIAPSYKDVIEEIKLFWKEKIEQGINMGMKRSQFILDPGIGFGKRFEDNIHIIKNIDKFKEFDLPILIGVSKKGFLGAILKDVLNATEPPPTDERVEAGLAAGLIAINNGANIIRTHNIGETKKFISTLEYINEYK